MNSTKPRESSAFSLVLASTCSQTTASDGRPGADFSAASAASEMEVSICSIAIEPGAWDVELAQVAEDDARLLARDVAEDHVAVRASLPPPVKEHHVETAGDAFEDLERPLREVLQAPRSAGGSPARGYLQEKLQQIAVSIRPPAYLLERMFPRFREQIGTASTSSSSSRPLASTAWRPRYPAPRAPPPTPLARHRRWEARCLTHCALRSAAPSRVGRPVDAGRDPRGPAADEGRRGPGATHAGAQAATQAGRAVLRRPPPFDGRRPAQPRRQGAQVVAEQLCLAV